MAPYKKKANEISSSLPKKERKERKTGEGEWNGGRRRTGVSVARMTRDEQGATAIVITSSLLSVVRPAALQFLDRPCEKKNSTSISTRGAFGSSSAGPAMNLRYIV